MAMYFSEKFKQLRKARDLTQEQTADVFRVSPQAVSRWETGATYPDIELLPHIAIFFKVTIDELLGVEAILGEEKAAGYLRDIRNLHNSGRIYDAIDTAREAVREYPANHTLQYQLLETLCAACTVGVPDYEKNVEKFKDEIKSAGERIMNGECQGDFLDQKFLLIVQYSKWKMTEEAKKIVLSLPTEAYYTQDYTMGYVLEGEEWQENQKLRIIRFNVILCDFLRAYADRAGFDVMRKIECVKAIAQIEKLSGIVINGSDINDLQKDHIGDAFYNINLAGLYCDAGDSENALECVEEGTRESMYHTDAMDETAEDGSNYFPWPTTRNLCWIMWEDYLSKSRYDVIRNTERFSKCFERLKANSRELKN